MEKLKIRWAVMAIVQHYELLCDVIAKKYDFELAFECLVITQLSRAGNLGCVYIFFTNYLPVYNSFQLLIKL